MMIKGESDSAADAVINLVLTVEPGGKVTGESPENGRRMLGIPTPPYIIALDVTLDRPSRQIGSFPLA